ncbi:CopG family transcriptional regulator [Sphingomonas sp. GB1N7]|uniref:CopG family transcriptional regulator n=1 Tax=Parasphingomonas caseinilytica TaxID=3096158 RepID=UPI002FC61C08
MRTLIDLPEDDIRWLDVRASEEKKSRAALVREAVSAFRAESNNDWIKRGAGYWKNRSDIGDAVEYQQAMREDRTID